MPTNKRLEGPRQVKSRNDEKSTGRVGYSS